MASIYEKEPIYLLERTRDDKTKLPKKYKFSGKAGKAKVHIDSGSLGLEFFYDYTLHDFMHTGTKLDWSQDETFSEFENILAGSYRTAWRTVLADNLPPALSDESDVENPKIGFKLDKDGFR